MLHLLSSYLHNEELKLPFEIPEIWLHCHQVVAVPIANHHVIVPGHHAEKFKMLMQ